MPDLTVDQEQFARFACKTFREQCETLRATGVESEEPLGDVCEAGFVDLLPPICIELPACPGCGGPSEVQEALTTTRS
jgi:hypothetical protein